jgi:photosystem II stability/assembly factor-like uncharacterized protein
MQTALSRQSQPSTSIHGLAGFFGRAVAIKKIGRLLALSAASAYTFVLLSVSQAGAMTYYWGNPKPQGNSIRAIAMIDAQAGVAVGVKGTVLRTTDAGTSWTDLSNWAAFTAGLYGVRALPDGSLLAVGESPGVFRSTNQGSTWSPVANPSSGTLFHLAHVSGQVYSAIGDGGRIIRSTDNGATWVAQPSVGTSKLVDQFWFDPQNGYILGPDLVRRTTNGGQTWLSLPDVQENFFLPGDIQFLDPQNGWLLVDFMTWRTTNGGASWFQKHGGFGQGPGYQQEAVFLDANTRWVCTEGEGGDIFKTTDDGQHWQLLYQRNSIGGYSELIRIPGGRLLAASTAGDLLRSDDNGASWVNFTRAPGDGERHRLESITALPDGRCFAGGDGAWLISSDFGHNWTAPPSAPNMNIIYSIAFRGNLGLAAGSPLGGQSKIARTTDGGATWTQASLSSSYVGDGQSVSLPSDQTAFVATYGGTTVNYVFRSTDAGATWQQRTTGLSTNVRLSSIFFLDERTGFVGGGDFGDPRIWKTTDGGGQWTPVGLSGFGSDGVTDMHWFDSSRGVVATFDGLFRTSNGGQSWSWVNNQAYNRIDFIDDQRGYASDLYSREFETTDGGQTWSAVPIPFDSYYFDIAATPNGFLIVGDGSSIFGGERDATGVPGPQESVDAPSSPRFPVYASPNPAAGEVKLRFLSPSAGEVRVEIFDPQGRRVDSWSAQVGPGLTTLPWKGVSNGRAAGVYLARVSTASGRSGAGRFVLLGKAIR